VPYGDVTERGLYYLGFSAERDRFDGMLAQMFGTSDDGLRDHLIDFSTPTTGSYYFAPSIEDLTAIHPER
jgi:putative iron-dependent peroxidase